MATLPAAYHKPQPALQKFDGDFIERRMREHRAWQEKVTLEACLEVVEEIEEAQRIAADRAEHDIRRSPLFRSNRHRHAISPLLGGAQ